MQVSVEESGTIERKITISVPSEKITTEVNKRLKDVAKKARIPGFRPGKAPQSVIKKRYEPQVTNDVVGETINSSYVDALGQEKIVPAGLISIDPTPYEPGQDLKFVATVELFPEIPSPTLSGRTVEKPIVEITAEDVDNTLEDIRKRNTNFEAKRGQSEKGDRVTIDFDGKIDGAAFEGGSATDFVFVLGEGQMLGEFDSGLMGVNNEEIKEIAFTFPEEYGSPEVAGKEVVFMVTVKKVEQPVLPELNDDFAATLGIKEGGLEKMKTEIDLNLNRELDTKLRNVIRDRVMEELFASNSVEAPKALVEEEKDRMAKNLSEQMTAQGLPTDKIDRENYADEAKKRVALGLIAREIIEKSEIKITEENIRARIVQMSTGYDDSEAYVNWHFADPERLKDIESVLLEEEIVNRMLETATVKEVKQSFKDFMNPQGD